jgi:hypothetical protein
VEEVRWPEDAADEINRAALWAALSFASVARPGIAEAFCFASRARSFSSRAVFAMPSLRFCEVHHDGGYPIFGRVAQRWIL